MNQELLYSIGFLAFVTVLLTLWVRRRNASSWAGVIKQVREVQKTHHQTREDPGSWYPTYAEGGAPLGA